MNCEINEPWHCHEKNNLLQRCCWLICTFVVPIGISGQFFRILKIIMFCFVVAICDLMHNVETIFHLSYMLTASGNLF